MSIKSTKKDTLVEFIQGIADMSLSMTNERINNVVTRINELDKRDLEQHTQLRDEMNVSLKELHIKFDNHMMDENKIFKIIQDKLDGITDILENVKANGSKW